MYMCVLVIIILSYKFLHIDAFFLHRQEFGLINYNFYTYLVFINQDREITHRQCKDFCGKIRWINLRKESMLFHMITVRILLLFL